MKYSNSEDFVLRININSFEILSETNTFFHFNYEKLVVVREKIESDDKTVYIFGRLRHEDYGLVRNLSNLHRSEEFIAQLYSEIPDFGAIVVDSECKVVQLFCSLSGSNRFFYHLEDSILTVTDNLKSQLISQRKPTFSDYGVYTALTLNYFQDPYTYLSNTFIVPLGYELLVENSLPALRQIVDPVSPKEKYPDIHSACQGLEIEIDAYFDKMFSNDREPIVMLSGGLDSLVLMKSMAHQYGKNFKSMTFAIEGALRHELGEAEIASNYYSNDHSKLIIQKDELLRHEIKTQVDTDFFQLGSAFGQGVNDWLVKNERSNIDIIRGEDTRLHTPFIDLPFKIGFFFTKAKSRKSVIASLWKVFKVLRLWKFQLGKNYISYFLNKIQPCDTTQEYILHNLLRLSYELKQGPNYKRLLEETANLSRLENLSQVHREAIRCMYKIQLSKDVHDTSRFITSPSNKVLMPFMSSRIVSACAKIPYHLSSRTRFVSPKKTRSYFFFIDKIILSKLLENKAPNDLIYRRKSTAPNHELIYDHCYDRLYNPLINNYGKDFINQFTPGETRDLLEQLFEKYRHKREDNISFDSVWKLNLFSSLIVKNLIRKGVVSTSTDLERILGLT